MNRAKLCVLGLGYIGLPTSAMFASHGHEVIGVDLNDDVVNALNRGEIIIEEPYLDILVQAAVTSGNLKAYKEPKEADVFIIAVPTPITNDKKADLTFVESATKAIVPYLQKGNIVILESTSPTGTTEELMKPIIEESGLLVGKDIYVGHSPERVLPGQILMELVNNNRIIGGIGRESAEKIRDVYKTFVKGEMYLTSATTAEMCKMMENTFRDVNIALANELAKLCESMGINAWEVIELCNHHPRVNLHLPGPGVGGHCLAVDPWFIVEKQPELAKIIRMSRETNDSMPEHVLNHIEGMLEGVTGKVKVVVLGMTYKPNVDDIRESPIVELMSMLDEKNYEVSVYDPYVKSHKNLCADLDAALDGADIAVLAVGHDLFNSLDINEISRKMKTPRILDTRNFFKGSSIDNEVVEYKLLGSNRSTCLSKQFIVNESKIG